MTIFRWIITSSSTPGLMRHPIPCASAKRPLRSGGVAVMTSTPSLGIRSSLHRARATSDSNRTRPPSKLVSIRLTWARLARDAIPRLRRIAAHDDERHLFSCILFSPPFPLSTRCDGATARRVGWRGGQGKRSNAPVREKSAQSAKILGTPTERGHSCPQQLLNTQQDRNVRELYFRSTLLRTRMSALHFGSGSAGLPRRAIRSLGWW